MPRRSIDRSTKGTGDLIDLKTGQLAEKPVYPVLCERIRFFREKSGLEQKALAKQIGVSSNAVSNWENGRGRPDINLLPDICAALGITMYDLYALEDPSVRRRAAVSGDIPDPLAGPSPGRRSDGGDPGEGPGGGKLSAHPAPHPL